MIIGITGGFGSGKTTVSNLFKKYNFKVINVDKLYSKIYKKNKSLKNKLKKEFGTANRAKIKKIVFNDYKKLQKLNKITHPLILKETIKQIKKIINNEKKALSKKTEEKAPINKNALKKIRNRIRIIVDAPLLLESNAKKLVDKIIVVKCNKNIQIKRILNKKKKKYSKEEIENIIKSQMPLKKKLKYADFAVDNSFSISNTEKQVKGIIKKISTP